MSEIVQTEYLKDLEEYSKPTIIESKPNEKESNKFNPKPDPILLRLFPSQHPLSSEEQSLFIKVTEGSFGYNEQIRNETLQVVARDYNIKFLTPYLCNFITEAIHVNIAFPDLSLLIYAVRMAKSLMGNSHVNLKPHLHLILPAVLSCVVSKKISKYIHDNHWTLRDFSSQVIQALCANYSNKINNIANRVIKIYLKPIQDSKASFTSLYGGLKGLSCLGEDHVRNYIIPSIPSLSWRIGTGIEQARYVTDAPNETKQIKTVTDLILSICSPILLKTRNVDDGGLSYVKEFGYLGYPLYTQVKTLERVANEEKKHNYNVYLFCGGNNNNYLGGCDVP